MNAIDASELSLPAIGDLSYSAWSRMRACRLKAAFSVDERTRALLRGGVLSAIGNARHSLVELVTNGGREGRGTPQSAWVRLRFDHLLNEERAKLQAQWAPAEVPPIRTWPDIALTKARLARTLGSLDGRLWPDLSDQPVGRDGTAAYGGGQPVARQNPVPPEFGEARVEVTLRDPNRGLWGRIDRLENRSGILTVVDLKSGIGVRKDRLADRHRLQMLFYGGLVQAAFGVWPMLEIVPVDGSAVTVDYEPTDIEAVRAEAVADRAALNAAVSKGRLGEGVQANATKCAWCPFQVVCPALVENWRSLTSSDNRPLHRAVSLVQGEIKEARGHASSTEVVIRQPGNLTAPRGEVIVTRLPAGSWANRGAEVAISRVAPSASDRVLRATWDSLIWPLPGVGQR